MTAPDLFTYPDAPGWKGQDTSRDAAQSMAPKAAAIRERVWRELRLRGPATPEEVAGRLNLDVMSIRPRFSELKLAGRIEPTGKTRMSRTGRRAKVWRVCPQSTDTHERAPR